MSQIKNKLYKVDTCEWSVEKWVVSSWVEKEEASEIYRIKKGQWWGNLAYVHRPTLRVYAVWSFI